MMESELSRKKGIVANSYEIAKSVRESVSDEFSVELVKEAVISELTASGRLDSVCEHVNQAETSRDCQSLGSHNEGMQSDRFWDDVSGKTLFPDLVRRAREEEMKHIKDMDVYCKVPITQCIESTGSKPIGTRWVDINKSDDDDPQYRSRLVAKEINTHKRDDLFVATPPLEAQKLLMSFAVTSGVGYNSSKSKGMKLDFIDVRRAYYHANVRREVFVELPPEDHEEGTCAKLNKAMPGTRDAAQNWECEYSAWLKSIGFSSGKSSPCLCHNPGKELRLVVHGDDFTLLGNTCSLDWFRSEIAKRYEVKFRGRVGPAKDYQKSITILNRAVNCLNTKAKVN